MKKIIALTLIMVMLFALSACGKEEAPEVTEAPVVQTEEPVVESAEPSVEPTTEPSPEPTPVGVEYDSGIYTFISAVNGISFDYDSKNIAMQNPMGNVTVFASGEAEIPYCTISLMAQTDALSYLKDIAASSKLELEGSLVTEAAEPTDAGFEGKEVYTISYSYTDIETEDVIVCSYYAETLENGDAVIYNSIAVEGDTAGVEEIIKLAVETFKLSK